MSDAPGPVVVLAFDGVDWNALLELAGEGRLPALTRMLAEGYSAGLAHPAPHSASTHWATVASGNTPDQHGVCHPWARRPDGLIVEPATAACLHTPPFWYRVWEAGRVARVAGWPATLGTRLPAAAPAGSCLVADGFAHAQAEVAGIWPLAPDAVVPPAERAAIRASRLHPRDVPQAAVDAALQGLPETLADAARQRLACWGSVYQLGLRWAAKADAGLIALRFDGMLDWFAALAEPAQSATAHLAGVLQQLDHIVGGLRDALPASTHLVLMTETAAPLFLETRVVADTVTGIPALRAAGYRLAGLGGLLVVGPSVVPARADVPVSALRVAPTVLGLLGLPVTEQPPATLPWQVFAAPTARDGAASVWLQDHACQAPDMSFMQGRALRVQAESLAGWALARCAQGHHAQGAQALQQALAWPLDGATAGSLHLLLAQALVNAGQGVPAAVPSPAASPSPSPSLAASPSNDPVTAELLAALAAWAQRDWPQAEHLLRRLIEFAPQAIAARAAGWLGRARLAQGDAAGAEPLLADALHQDAADAEHWIAWCAACMALGRSTEALQGLRVAEVMQPGHAGLAASAHALRGGQG